jgi:hypothetical protein
MTVKMLPFTANGSIYVILLLRGCNFFASFTWLECPQHFALSSFRSIAVKSRDAV